MAENAPNPRDLGRYFALAQVGLEMVAPIVLGLFLDSRLGWTPWGVVAGAVIGATFGVVRAAPVLSVAGVRRPDQLLRVDAVLARWAAPARRATYAAGALVASAALLGAARW